MNRYPENALWNQILLNLIILQRKIIVDLTIAVAGIGRNEIGVPRIDRHRIADAVRMRATEIEERICARNLILLEKLSASWISCGVETPILAAVLNKESTEATVR